MTNTFRLATRFLKISGLFFFIALKGFSQTGISGPTCVNPNSTATYTISGAWGQTTTMTWSCVGGTITPPSSGTPKVQITVTWGTSTGTKSVSVSKVNPSGSATITVVFGPAFVPGTISNPTQSINYNTIPAQINCSLPTGGACTPAYTYQWQQSSSLAGTYTNISGATSQNLSFTTPITATTYYKRFVTETTTSQTLPSTNTATVTVYAQIAPGSVTPNPLTINYGTSPGQLTGSLPTGGNGTYTYQWQQSPDGTSWTTISGAVSQNYTPGNLTSTDYFQRIVSSNGASANTPSDKITVVVPVFGVTAPTNSTGNLNSDLDWIQTTGYDPSGNILSQQKEFYDKSANLTQHQWKEFYRKNATTVYTHVFASVPLNDVYGRPVLGTLGAPIDYADFSYSTNFMQDNSGNSYSYKNFDRFQPTTTETDKTNSPDPIGGQAIKGTLGWYYGPNNYWEPYVSNSNYPYFRNTFYREGSNDAKKQANVGEAFVMGSSHEISTLAVPVSGELTNYLLVRNRFFTSAQVGQLPTTLQNSAIVKVTKDPNATELLSISDLKDEILMTAKPGSDLVVTNAVSIASVSSIYTQQVNCVSGTGVTIQSISSGNLISIYLINGNGTITSVYSGTVAGVPYNTNLGTGSIVILSDIGFSINYTSNSVAYTTSSLTDPGGSIPAIGYFKVYANATPITISGSYTLYDMNSEAAISLNAGTLDKGYYKVIASSGIVNLSYNCGFTDVTYNFYNQLGQLVATVPPNGVKLLETGYTSYPTLASVPYVNIYTYDVQGRLLNSSTTDAGPANILYRMDGKPRFSQNAVQTAAGSFSYTNYNQYGQVIETGQYTPGSGGVVYNSTGMTSILETVAANGGLTNGTQTDVIMTTYDLPDNSHNLVAYVQDPSNLSGKISTQKRYSSVVNNSPLVANLVGQTWYNYDEEGKFVWKIINNPALGVNGYKTTDYAYDAMSRLIKKVFQKNVSAETFVHYFQYDAANGKLSQVYTNTIDNGPSMLQANYVYYLQGGLKRIELAGNLQGVDYTYTLDGRLKAINNSNNTSFVDPGQDATGLNGFSQDVFGEVLDYYIGDYTNTRNGAQPITAVNSTGIANDNFTGNVKAMTWYSNKGGLGSNSPTTYFFNYDPKYQLTTATWGNNINFATVPAALTTTNFNQEKVVLPGTSTPAYDDNGNILNLLRTDPNGITTDQFAYNYATNKNQLANIQSGPIGSQTTYGTYSYDQLGREISEVMASPTLNKYLQYDALGKVTMVANDAAFTKPIVKYVYDESGRRIQKISYSASYAPNFATYYYDDVIYSQSLPGGTLNIDYQIEGGGTRLGTYSQSSGLYVYEMTDHLGNVRATVSKNGTGFQMNLAKDYYPFGLPIAVTGTNYRYGFQGQNSEEDGETTWNNFDLRMYNSKIAKWSSTDPAGQFASPYIGMGNNPTSSIDKDGAFDGYWQAWWYQWWNGGYIIDDGNSYSVNLPHGTEGMTIAIKWDQNHGAAYNVWNSNLVREHTPDYITLGGQFTTILGIGQGSSLEAIFTIHGPQASWKPMITTTQSAGLGFSEDFAAFATHSSFSGRAEDIRRDMMLNKPGSDKPTVWATVAITEGATDGIITSVSKVKNGYITTDGGYIGAGLPLGPLPMNAAAGISYTFLLHDFYSAK